MNRSPCTLCRGAGEVTEVRLVPCCSGRNAWGEVVCGCGGMRWPEDYSRPCPRGCLPMHLTPLAPCQDPFCW